ncbi:D-2-hydroxyglutarate dehydrogenase, mitochondrial isoform X2 [Bradysia coprophila]|uniref:D-2-hydroxyglutarate dehydrogenase, mitochondrial isoform X2 n=2 Tax=Bradysia coprophila TaxID=38358 RepID=UPI00187DD29E|nr:D-2-hydroxyglutarate dehydrogenase, mitochondrial isoform X2 [Bradysia coprophila]
MLSSLRVRNIVWKQASLIKRSYNASAQLPDLTKDRYQVKRGDYSQVTDADVGFFQSILENSRVLLDESDTQSYNIDFMKSVRGFSRVVLKPKTTEEVSGILRYCNDRKLAVCPQGGNTGLVGGSVPVFDEIVVSTQLMNRIDNIDELSGTLECQSGCILEQLEQAVSEKGLCMPLDLGAKGSCHIGGNVSTNAGGIRLLRYGNLHGSVLGVEAVKADGTVLDLMSNFKKDNTGYHLKHMFIGSEGTLGFLTKVSIFCPTASRAINVAFLGLESYDAVLKTFLAAKRDLGEILSSCEMIDQEALDCSLNAFNLRSPISKYPFYMLIETSGSRMDHDEEKLNNFLQHVMEKRLVLDGTVTNEPGKMKLIWTPRESIGQAIFKDTYSFSYDVSLPLKHFYDLVDATRKQLDELPVKVFGFGHIGDSNLHLVVRCSEFDPKVYQRLEPFVYAYTSKLCGSISSEHGIGFLKTNYLKYSKKSECFDVMKEVKRLMDPNGILNPYKVLPERF